LEGRNVMAGLQEGQVIEASNYSQNLLIALITECTSSRAGID